MLASSRSLSHRCRRLHRCFLFLLTDKDGMSETETIVLIATVGLSAVAISALGATVVRVRRGDGTSARRTTRRQR